MSFSFILNQYLNDTQQNSLIVIVKHLDKRFLDSPQANEGTN